MKFNNNRFRTNQPIKIIFKQQNSLLTINNSLPSISCGLILLGIILLIWGITSWKKRQTVLDRIQDEELKSKEIQNLTSQEKRDILEDEIAVRDELEDEITDSKKPDIESEIDTYIQVENSIYLQLKEHFKVSYQASQNVKIGDFTYDIILKSKDLLKSPRDRVVEIKFFKNRLTYENVKDAATKLILACSHYEESFRRKTAPLLIIIYNDSEYDETVKLFKKKIELYGTELGKQLKVNFFDKTQIVNTKATDFFK